MSDHLYDHLLDNLSGHLLNHLSGHLYDYLSSHLFDQVSGCLVSEVERDERLKRCFAVNSCERRTTLWHECFYENVAERVGAGRWLVVGWMG